MGNLIKLLRLLDSTLLDPSMASDLFMHVADAKSTMQTPELRAVCVCRECCRQPDQAAGCAGFHAAGPFRSGRHHLLVSSSFRKKTLSDNELAFLHAALKPGHRDGFVGVALAVSCAICVCLHEGAEGFCWKRLP